MEQNASEKFLRMRRRNGEIHVCVTDLFPCFGTMLRDMAARPDVTKFVNNMQRHMKCNSTDLLYSEGSQIEHLWAHYRIAMYIVTPKSSEEFRTWLADCATDFGIGANMEAESARYPIPDMFIARYDDKRVKVLKQ